MAVRIATRQARFWCYLEQLRLFVQVIFCTYCAVADVLQTANVKERDFFAVLVTMGAMILIIILAMVVREIVPIDCWSRTLQITFNYFATSLQHNKA